MEGVFKHVLLLFRFRLPHCLHHRRLRRMRKARLSWLQAEAAQDRTSEIVLYVVLRDSETSCPFGKFMTDRPMDGQTGSLGIVTL